MTGPDLLDEAAAVLAALPWEPPTARQVTEAATKYGWRPDAPWFLPAVPAVPPALRGHDRAVAEER